MAISRKALRASAKARKGEAQKGDLRSLLNEGEKAFLAGKFLQDNPYAEGTEEWDIWGEGWEDARLNLGK